MRWLLFIGTLLTLSSAHSAAQDCDPKEDDCSCEDDWGCWEFVYAAPGTVLGGRASVTYLSKGQDPLDGAFLMSYFTEHFGTREGLTVHVAADGALGGGSAGVEGMLGAGLDFGWRGSVTAKSGPFLRAGMQGLLLGHRALYLSFFEPLQARVGYQYLDADHVFELGMTQGLIPVGQYEPEERTHSLARSVELGAYASLHWHPVRVRGSFMHLLAPAGSQQGPFDLARLLICSYSLQVSVCADATYGHARTEAPGSNSQSTHSLYGGLTLGLSP
jgi:hypothetical protein